MQVMFRAADKQLVPDVRDGDVYSLSTGDENSTIVGIARTLISSDGIRFPSFYIEDSQNRPSTVIPMLLRDDMVFRRESGSLEEFLAAPGRQFLLSTFYAAANDAKLNTNDVMALNAVFWLERMEYTIDRVAALAGTKEGSSEIVGDVRSVMNLVDLYVKYSRN